MVIINRGHTQSKGNRPIQRASGSQQGGRLWAVSACREVSSHLVGPASKFSAHAPLERRLSRMGGDSEEQIANRVALCVAREPRIIAAATEEDVANGAACG